jgi:hypothetical protein
MAKNGASDILEWSLNVQNLYEDLLKNYPDVRMSREDFRSLLERALTDYFRDNESVPAILLLAGLLRLYQSKA